MNTEIAAPDVPSKIRLSVKLIVLSPNVVSIVDSRVSIDTQAEARLIAFDAEKTGLLYLRYFTMFTVAIVNEVNV